MRSIIRKVIILTLCLYSAFFFMGGFLAPVFAHFKNYDLSAMLTSLYVYSCHQQPNRTFWIMGYPMALCCRCFGFYIGVFSAGIADLFDKLNVRYRVFIILLLISVIDITLNFCIKFNTGNIIRFIVGIIMGLLFVVVISHLLKGKWRKENYES